MDRDRITHLAPAHTDSQYRLSRQTDSGIGIGSKSGSTPKANQSMRKLTFPLMLASCGAGMVLSPDSHALSFGMIKVHSYLEQPLDASISYSNSPADGVTLGDGSCIQIDRDKSSESGLPVITKLQLQLDGSEQSGVLRIRSIGPIGEPVAVIRLRNQCDNSGNIVREFTFFLDPQPEIRLKGENDVPKGAGRINLPQSAAPVHIKKQRDVPTKEIWTVKRGDTLTRIAQHFEPDPAQQKAMAKAILASNPSVRSADLINIGQKLAIPDLTVLYAANAVNPDKAAGSRIPAEALARNRARPQDQETPPQPTRHAGNAADSGAPEYQLKLTPTQPGGMPPGKNDSGSGGPRHGATDSDDKTAEMLALNEKISNLEQQMESLRLQLQMAPRMAAPGTAAAPGATAPTAGSTGKPAKAKPVIGSVEAAEQGMPTWALAGAGGVLAAAIAYLVYRRRHG